MGNQEGDDAMSYCNAYQFFETTDHELVARLRNRRMATIRMDLWTRFIRLIVVKARSLEAFVMLVMKRLGNWLRRFAVSNFGTLKRSSRQ